MGIHTLDFYLQSMAESCSKRYFLQEFRKYELYKFRHWNPSAFLPQALESSPAFLIHPMSEFSKREASQPDHLQSRLPGLIGIGWTCSASCLSPTWESICWTEYMRIISQTHSVTPANCPSISTNDALWSVGMTLEEPETGSEILGHIVLPDTNRAHLLFLSFCYSPDSMRVSLGLRPKVILQSFNLNSHRLSFDIIMWSALIWGCHQDEFITMTEPLLNKERTDFECGEWCRMERSWKDTRNNTSSVGKF